MLKYLSFLLCAAVFAGPAWAQQRDVDPNGRAIPIVRKAADGGLEYTGNLVSRAEFVATARYQAGGIDTYGFPTVILAENERYFAVTSAKGVDAIHRHFGGKGSIPPYANSTLPDATDKTRDTLQRPARDNVIDLDAVAAEQGPVAIFSDADIGAINPQDGTWASQVSDISTTGCPPGVEGAALAMMGGGAQRSVTFTQPWWEPGDISAEFAQYTWRPVGSNGYFSVPFKTGPEASGSGMSMSVTMGLNAVAPDRIAVWGRVNLKLSQALAAMAGGSQDCVALVTGSYVRQ